MKPVLLLVDLQNDFLLGPRLEPHPASVVAAAERVLHACRATDIPVIHVWTTVSRAPDNRMPHRKRSGEWSCVEGTPGHACPDVLQPRAGELIVQKNFFSAFSTGELGAALRGLKADLVILAGVHLHACLRATALDAYAEGYRVLAVEDGSASDDPLHAAITKRYLQDRSIAFRGSEEIVAAIETTSEKIEQFFTASPEAKKSEIASACQRARKTLINWRETPAAERLKILHLFARSLEQRTEELVELLISDIGKPIRYARAEVGRALALIAAGDKQLLPATDRHTGYRREPLGLVALISPFNNPLAIPIGKIVPALLFGNVVIWKPAIPGSRIAKLTTEIFARATDRSDLLQMINGSEETARAVMEACDAVTISGSLKAGYAAREICARNSIPLQAELGGNNASIVWDDADLPAAARAIAEGAFVFAGQRCTANRRAIVSAKIYDAFLEELIAASRALVCGDPRDENTHLGPLISAASGRRVRAIIERARAASHRVITAIENADAQWVAPTIICCDDGSAEIVQEETFGPVLVVQRAKDWDEAIALCNGVKQGLAAALFSTSPQLIDDFLRRVQAGILKIDSSTADAAVDLPFGGWKASGIGPPEHYPANHEFFTRFQAIYFPA